MSELEVDYFSFPTCMHALSGALHRECVDPEKVEILLPWSEWWRLHCALERKFRGLMRYAGLGETPQSFKYMGFKFTVKR
jgi:hypothetical protein